MTGGRIDGSNVTLAEQPFGLFVLNPRDRAMCVSQTHCNSLPTKGAYRLYASTL